MLQTNNNNNTDETITDAYSPNETEDEISSNKS